MGRWAAIFLALLLTVTGAGPLASGTAPQNDAPATTPGALLEQLRSGAAASAFDRLADSEDAPHAPPIGTAAQALVHLSEDELSLAEATGILEQVPPALASDIDRLLVAMAAADTLVDAELARHTDASGDLPAAGSGPGSWIGLAAGPDASTEPAPEIATSARSLDVDTGPFLRAQAILTDAIEPLRSGLTTPQQIQGCPVHEAPYVIVCGEDPKTYAPGEDAILIVDLGGDDVYQNSQGSPFGTLSVLPQIIVDAAGDDTYERTRTVLGGETKVVAQGAAQGGIGALVDLTGDDRYIARAEHVLGGGQTTATVIAQGAAELGVGLLVDPAGNDCVLARALAKGAPAETTAQGAAILGAGLAVLTGTHTAADCPPGPRAEAIADPLVLPSSPENRFVRLGASVLTAQGGADGGAGVLQGGPFADAYTAIARGGAAQLLSQGASDLGVGLLHDAGGEDTYDARGQGHASIRGAVSGNYLWASARARLALGSVKTTAQGATLSGVAGHLDEGLDANTLTARATIFGNATAEASTTSDAGRVIAEATGDVGRAQTTVHGAAVDGAALSAGASVLPALGATGDTREAESVLDVDVFASAGGAGESRSFANLTTADAASRGQGWTADGVGVLADAVGDDLYRLEADHEATATAIAGDPADAHVNVDAGTATTEGHATARSGIAALLDVQGDDTYEQTPGFERTEQDACYTGSPGTVTSIGAGLDALTTITVPDGCLPPPW